MREHLNPATLADCLRGHVAPDVADSLKTVDNFLNTYNLPGGVVLNLQAARKQLRLAISHVAAAQVIAESEVE